MNGIEQRFQDQLEEIRTKRENLKVCYIKLGKGGALMDDCVENNLLYIGYHTCDREMRDWCNRTRNVEDAPEAEEKIKKYWLEDRKKTPSTAKNFQTSILRVVKDKGETLWITIENRRVFYGLSSGDELVRHEPWENKSPNSGSAKRMKFGWCKSDINGNILNINKLSGALTKTGGMQGTIAEIKKPVADYFIAHILGESLVLKDKAKKILIELEEVCEQIIKDLQPSEFEVLVDLIFCNSGWKRDGELGGNIKFVDVTLKLPTTNETAGVQVKSKFNNKEFKRYMEEYNKGTDFNKFFYVYHTGEMPENDRSEDKKDKRIVIWGSKEVAKQAIEAGLSQWIIDRAYK